MALTSADLLEPKGPVTMRLYPGLDSNVVSATLTQYLASAYADARVAAQADLSMKDALARAWSLYLVFGSVYQRMLAEPATVDLQGDKGSHGYTMAQINGMKELRDKYLADFNGMLLVPETTPPRNLPGSMSVSNRVIF